MKRNIEMYNYLINYTKISLYILYIIIYNVLLYEHIDIIMYLIIESHSGTSVYRYYKLNRILLDYSQIVYCLIPNKSLSI